MLIESVEMLPVDTVEQGSVSREREEGEGEQKNSGNLRKLLGFSSVMSLESQKEDASLEKEKNSIVRHSIEELPAEKHPSEPQIHPQPSHSP